MSAGGSVRARMQDSADFILLLRDVGMLAVLPMIFRVSLSGASLEFSNREQFFQGLANTGGSMIEQIGTLAMFALSLLIMAVRGIPLQIIWRIGLPFIPFYCLALLSVGWSDFPELSLRRAARLSIEGFTVIAIGASYADRPRRLLRLLFYFLLAVVAGDLLMLAARPSSFTAIGFAGLHPHKLEAGKAFLIAIAVFLAALADRGLVRDRRIALAGLLLAVLLMPLTRAKTAWVALIFATAGAYLAWRILRGGRLNRIIAPLALAAAGLAFIGMAIGGDPAVLVERVFGDATITGRDIIWRFVFDRYRDHEWLGVGYGGLWQTGPELVRRLKDGYRIYVVNQAHNGYIEVLVQTGIIGVLCLIYAIAHMGWRLLRSMHDVEPAKAAAVAIAIYLFVAMLVINLTDTTMFWANSSLWTLPLLFYALADAARRLKQTPRARTTLAAALGGKRMDA